MSADGTDPRRANPRHSGEVFSCVLGEVVDVSSAGLRVRCKQKPPFSEGALTTIKLAFKGGKLQVSVQERWRKRRGFRGYEIGMKFVSNSPSAMAAIDSLVTFGFINPNAGAQGGCSAEPKSKPKSRPKIRATVDLPDYYATLEVASDADTDRVHAAYRKLARQYHPDANKAPGAEAKFIAVCEAYKVLSDDQQRKSYDLRQAG
jgi:DnaJ-like protein/PilZ domain-containing protein